MICGGAARVADSVLFARAVPDGLGARALTATRLRDVAAVLQYGRTRALWAAPRRRPMHQRGSDRRESALRPSALSVVKCRDYVK